MSVLKKIYKNIIKLIFYFLYGKISIGSSQKFKKVFKINKSIIYNFFEIDNCRIFTNTNDVAYIQNSSILKGPSLQIRKKGKNSNIRRNAAFKHGTPKIYKYFNKRVFSLLSGLDANYNYFHWFFDSLPRFFLFKKFYRIKKDDFFLVQNYKSNFQKQSLKILGIKNIINAYDLKHVKAKKIIAVEFNRKKDDPPKWLIKDLRIFYNKFKKKRKENFIKVFIDRGKSASEHRDIHNKKDITDFLKKNNFKIIDPSKLTFLNEIRLFQKCRIVVGMYGAGLTNIIFCKKGCKVIQLKNFKVDDLYENIAKKLGLKFFSIKGKKIGKKISKRIFDGTIYVDLNKLKKLI